MVVLREPDTETDALAHAVIGASIEVHRQLGPGFLEQIYEEALCVELRLRDVPFQRQRLVKAEYKGGLRWGRETRLARREPTGRGTKGREELRADPQSKGHFLPQAHGTPTGAADQLQRSSAQGRRSESHPHALTLAILASWRFILGRSLGAPRPGDKRATDFPAEN